MNILGILLLLILPYGAGLILNIITRQKETNQSETYLIGFFSLFLLQGVVFSLHSFLGLPFELTCKIYSCASYAIVVTGLLVGVCVCRSYIKESLKKCALRKDEILVFTLMVIAFALVVVRLCSIYYYGRDDIMLETVRVNSMTGTVNVYNPLTSRPYELGIINSRKIITLPVYYTYWCMTYNIGDRVLLYIVASLQTLFCLFFACKCAMTAILKTNKKVYTFMMFVAVLLLSGDYFKGAVGYKVLWNGYSGETIVIAVMLPYLIYLVMDMYKIEKGEYGPRKWKYRISRVFRIILTLLASVFITELATGALLIILSLATVIVCCTVKYGREEHGHE